MMNKNKPAKKNSSKNKESTGKAGNKTGKRIRRSATAKSSRADARISVLFAASEVYPFVKTGGLADVSCYLPLALNEIGLDVRIILPAYRCVLEQGIKIKKILDVQVPGTISAVKLLQTKLPGGDNVVYLVDAPVFFDRPGNPYQGINGEDWPDNAERFAFFGKMIRHLCLGNAGLDWVPNVLHCNDWHTGLGPALLSQEPARPASIFTIHTLSYQGLFPRSTFTALAIPQQLWSPDAMEFYGNMSFIKGGLVFADKLVTVSPRYAREITTPEFGYGLEGLLRYRSDDLTGILNGVDYRFWDPRHDPLIEQHYSIDNPEGKKINKKYLQQELGLHENEKSILLACIGRLVDQKGIDLIISGFREIFQMESLQLVILGTGDAGYERSLRRAVNSYPGRLSVHIAYDESLAHRIIAGADILLMPSRFEPCGLTQLYALRYGTIPLVRATGGLLDTVIDATDSTLLSKTATGFQFEEANGFAFRAALNRAVALFTSSREKWNCLMRTAMSQDFCWDKSAQQYKAVYQEAIRRRAG